MLPDQDTQSPGLTRIADYLVARLGRHGVEHVFGVPGNFVLRLFEYLETTDLTVVNTCDEQGAGFAADAYARMRGLGVVCVTYGVGGLKVANSTAQAWAEESPVVVISGAPAVSERDTSALLHHVVNGYDNQLRIFERLTVATAVLDDPETACREIDRVIDAALLHKRPVYLEIPRDMTLMEVPRPRSQARPAPRSDQASLAAAVDDAVSLLRAARQPGGVPRRRVRPAGAPAGGPAPDRALLVPDRRHPAEQIGDLRAAPVLHRPLRRRHVAGGGAGLRGIGRLPAHARLAPDGHRSRRQHGPPRAGTRHPRDGQPGPDRLPDLRPRSPRGLHRRSGERRPARLLRDRAARAGGHDRDVGGARAQPDHRRPPVRAPGLLPLGRYRGDRRSGRRHVRRPGPPRPAGPRLPGQRVLRLAGLRGAGQHRRPACRAGAPSPGARRRRRLPDDRRRALDLPALRAEPGPWSS